MRPKEHWQTGQSDLFRARLDQIVDLDHPMVKLAAAIDWRFLEEQFGAVYTDAPGRPPLPTRLRGTIAPFGTVVRAMRDARRRRLRQAHARRAPPPSCASSLSSDEGLDEPRPSRQWAAPTPVVDPRARRCRRSGKLRSPDEPERQPT